MAQNPRDWTDDYLNALERGEDPSPYAPPPRLGDRFMREMSEADALAIVDGLTPYLDNENFAQSAWRGLVEGAAQVAVAPGQALGKALGMTYDAQNEAIQGAIDTVAPEQAALAAEGSVTRQIAGAVGNVGGSLLVGVAGGPAAVASFGFGMSANEMADALRQSEIDGGERLGYMALNGLVGIADVFPVNRTLRRLDIVTGGGLGASLSRVDALRILANDAPTAWGTLREIAKQGGLGAITEGAQRAFTNALVAHATDDELNLLQGVVEEGRAGGAAQTLLAAAVELATRRRRFHVARAAQLALPEAEYRARWASDPAFRDAEIAAEMGEIIAQGVDPSWVAPDINTQDVVPAPGPVASEVSTESVVQQATAVPEADAVALPGSDTDSVRDLPVPTAIDARRVDGQQEVATEAAVAPSAVEAAPRTPSPRVRVAHSRVARTPVPGQSDPLGRPVYLITGTTSGMPWGGSEDNVIGAKSPTALKDIVQPLLEVLESFGIRVARRPGAAGNISGYYSAGGLLAADFGDVQVIAHEVGHFIHRSLIAGQNSASQVATNPNAGLSGLPPVIQGQIRGLAYRGTPPGLELTEGFAEAFRMWLTIPEVLANTAPETSRWISNWVVTQPTNVRSAITSAQQRARDYRFQGDQLRMVVQAPPTFLQRATSLLRGGWAKTWRAVYEDSGILDEIKPGLSEFWQGIRGSSRGWTDAWYEGRPTDLYGNAVEGARNFRQVVEPIKASERTLFDEYLVSLRTLALENKGTDTGKAPAEARRLVERLDTERPHFARVAHDLSQWWAGVNSVLAQASPTYAAQLARIQAADAALGVDFYAPLHRWLGTQSGRSWTRTSAQRRALAGVVSDRQEGSSLAVKSPLEAFVNEARVRFDQAVYRNLIEQIVTAFDATGGNKGPLVANINELQGDLAFGGAMPGVEDTNESLTLALLKPELKGEMIPVTVAHVNPATGKLRYRHLRVDRRIADVAARVDPTMLRQGMGFWSTLASRSLAFQRRGLSATQIQWNPGFQYATNLMLDLPTSYLASRYFRWYELHELLGYTARNILANALGTVKPWKSDWIKTYENLGLQGSAGLEGELRVGSTVRSGIGKAHTLRSMMQAAMAFLSIPQRAVQLANMQKAAKVYKIDINQPLSPEQASILRLAARTPTNYTAGGDVSRAMQVAVPFVRPFFEAQRQSVEAAKRNPLDFSIKLGVLTAAWTAMRYLLADDELEKKKTAADALRSITLPVPGSDEGVEFRIESTMAPFTMLPIMVIESMREQGQDPTDFIMASIGTLIPPTDVPLARLVGQMVANKSQPVMATISSGAQAPVVPNQLADREGLAQQTPSTAPLAVNIATVMDAALSGLPQSSPLRQNFASPIRWESAIRAMLGGNALTMAEGWGVIPGLHPNVEPEWADMLPGVVRRNGMTNWNNRDIRAIYDIDRAAQVKEATRDGLYLEKPSDRVMRERVRALAATLSGMRFLATYDAAGMTVKERRDIVRAAEKVARECLEEIRAGKPPTKYFEAQATYEARRKQYDINRGAFYR